MTAKNPPKTASTAQNSQETDNQPQTVLTAPQAIKERAKAAQRPYREIEKDALNRVLGVIQILQSVSPHMTLNQARVFLEIANNDGVENLRVREKTRLPHSSISNIVAALSPTSYHKKDGKPVEGYDLVLLTDSGEDGRAKNLHLTTKGKKVSERIVNKINDL